MDVNSLLNNICHCLCANAAIKCLEYAKVKTIFYITLFLVLLPNNCNFLR